MTNIYVGFDIETAKTLPAEADWRYHRPLGITCAALYLDREKNETWFSKDGDAYADQMPKERCQELVKRLLELQGYGYRIATWNGLGFDFNVLAEESEMYDECKEIAWNHVDMMFHILCDKGYPASLNAVSTFMEVGRKTEGASGAEAAQLWRAGEQDLILEYVLNDAKMTRDLARAGDRRNSVSWLSRRGNVQKVNFHTWSNVRACLAMPLPDTSWMDDPMTRESVMEWMYE